MQSEIVFLGDIVTHQKGFAFKSIDYVDSGVPVVRVSNFTNDSISTTDLKYVTETVSLLNHTITHNFEAFACIQCQRQSRVIEQILAIRI